MKNCRDIENLLPLYTEGVLSDEEKRAVEEHLADCPECQKELACLQKSGKLVEGLPAVEEPPWFRQRIMAQVRKEAEKKSIAQKWFYPLRIRIPVQIAATIVIAVLAVYIYRSGDEQVSRILPGVSQPGVEARKEQPPSELLRTRDTTPPAAQREKTALREEIKQDKDLMKDMAAGGAAEKSAAPQAKPPASDDADENRIKALAEKKEDGYPAVQSAPAAPAVPAAPEASAYGKAGFAEPERKAGDRISAETAKKKEARRMAATAQPRSMAASAALPGHVLIVLRVENMAAASADVEKMLAGFRAEIKSKKILEKKVIIQASFAGKDWKDILANLKRLGQVDEKALPGNIGERDIPAVIEIIHQD